MAHNSTHPLFPGEKPASIDWCEPNYVVTPWIAEFWNSFSSLAFVVCGVVGLWMRRGKPWEWRHAFMDIGIIVIGLGSFAFHATLILNAQLLDELPMLYSGLVWIFVVFRTFEKKGWRQTVIDALFSAALLTLAIVWTQNAVGIHEDANVVFEIVFGVMISAAAGFLLYAVWQSENRTLRTWFCLYFLTSITAFALWLIDQRFCGWINRNLAGYAVWKLVGSLHGYWHVLMGFSAWMGTSIAAYLRAEHRNLKPELKYHWGWCPYVTLVPKKQQ